MKQVDVLYDDYYLRRLDASEVVYQQTDNNVVWVALSRNLFYPKGGGQKGDRGVIGIGGMDYQVDDTARDKESGLVLLKLREQPSESLVGLTASSDLDWDFRYSQMRLHTTVHLHHCMMEQVKGGAVPYPRTSDIQDGFAFNRYEDPSVTVELVEDANAAMRNLIAKGAKVTTRPDPAKPGFRWWECLNWSIPCGGTHPADVKEVGNLEISYSAKKGAPTINFRLL